MPDFKIEFCVHFLCSIFWSIGKYLPDSETTGQLYMLESVQIPAIQWKMLRKFINWQAFRIAKPPSNIINSSEQIENIKKNRNCSITMTTICQVDRMIDLNLHIQ